MANLKSFVAKWSPVMQSILRIVIALLFVEHGAQKLFGFPVAIEGFTLSLFSLLGLAAILEFFGGLFVLLGLFTRPVAFILSGEMATAYFMAHAPKTTRGIRIPVRPNSACRMRACSASGGSPSSTA